MVGHSQVSGYGGWWDKLTGWMSLTNRWDIYRAPWLTAQNPKYLFLLAMSLPCLNWLIFWFITRRYLALKCMEVGSNASRPKPSWTFLAGQNPKVHVQVLLRYSAIQHACRPKYSLLTESHCDTGSLLADCLQASNQSFVLYLLTSNSGWWQKTCPSEGNLPAR